MKNNIFDYATSELSQDAFICWCVNWFNDDSRPALKEMAIKLLKKFSGAATIDKLDIFKQFSRNVTIKENEISLKIDVLLIVNGSIAVIIEDKTYTGEHDNQIKRYKDGLEYLASKADEKDFYGVKDIRTVFLKTGFMYDNDKCVKADVVITGEQFLEYLTPYEGNSEILDSYIAKLKELLQWYKDFGRYEETTLDSFWEWNIAKHQIAQYRLMRDIFPETQWKDRDSWLYRVYHGTNMGGRQWTEMYIFEETYKDTKDYYSVFWRIDTDNNGPFISLRFYEKLDKNDDAKIERHRNLYESMSATLKEIVTENSDKFFFKEWKDIYPGYRGNYRESSLIHLNIKEKLESWSDEKEKVIQSIRELTRLFCEKLEGTI